MMIIITIIIMIIITAGKKIVTGFVSHVIVLLHVFLGLTIKYLMITKFNIQLFNTQNTNRLVAVKKFGVPLKPQ